QEGGLPAAGRADDAAELAGRNREADVVQRFDRARTAWEHLGEVLDPKLLVGQAPLPRRGFRKAYTTLMPSPLEGSPTFWSPPPLRGRVREGVNLRIRAA